MVTKCHITDKFTLKYNLLPVASCATFVDIFNVSSRKYFQAYPFTTVSNCILLLYFSFSHLQIFCLFTFSFWQYFVYSFFFVLTLCRLGFTVQFYVSIFSNFSFLTEKFFLKSKSPHAKYEFVSWFLSCLYVILVHNWFLFNLFCIFQRTCFTRE